MPWAWKAGFQPREGFEGGIGARTFVGIENGRGSFRRGMARAAAAVAVGGDGGTDFDGHDFVLEFARGDGRERFLVAGKRELIGLLARNAIFAREIFGREAHAEVTVGVVIHQPRIGRHFVAAHRHQSHRFGAAGENHVRVTQHDALRGHGDGLQTGRAEAIDGHGRGFHGQAGAKQSDARDVHSLLGFGHGAAEDDVLDLPRVETRDAVDGRAHGDGGQIIGPRSAQRTFEGFADGGADGTGDNSVSHGLLP